MGDSWAKSGGWALTRINHTLRRDQDQKWGVGSYTNASPLPSQRLSALTELPSLQRQLVALLHHCRELERKSLEQGRAATLAGAHLARREATVEQLVQQNSDLVELLLQHRSLMEGASSWLLVDDIMHCLRVYK